MMQMLRVLKTELNQAALAASPSMPLVMAQGAAAVLSPSPASAAGHFLGGVFRSPSSSLIPGSFDY